MKNDRSKKRPWWPWAAGAAGVLAVACLVVCIVLAVLVIPRLASRAPASSTAAVTPAEIRTSSPLMEYVTDFDNPDEIYDWGSNGTDLEYSPGQYVQTYDGMPHIADGKLLVEMEKHSYMLGWYTLLDMQDVRMETQIFNRTNLGDSVGLICRASEDGYYSFFVNVWSYEIGISDAQNQYTTLARGTFAEIAPQELLFTIVCQGDQLSMYINDNSSPLLIVTDATLKSGMVGFEVSSQENYLPLLVEFDWMRVTRP